MKELPMHPSTGLVLSGGGARGAYEAGVISGLVEVLKKAGHKAPPFDIFCGTSVGAINAAWLAAHADVADLNVRGLVEQWEGLDINEHLRPDVFGWLGWQRSQLSRVALRRRRPPNDLVGRSMLDASGFEKIVRTQLPWRRLHRNIREGVVRALVVAALHIATGRTTIFVELAPGETFRESRDPRRHPSLEHIHSEHVLASAAIPVVFPARRIGNVYYCDGGIRFNTPISPAIRCGAERLVVISLLYEGVFWKRKSEPPVEEQATTYPSTMFLAGKILNALLLDPVKYDLQVLERFNELFRTLERILPPDELAEISQLTANARGLPYRQIQTLVFRPSQDIGHLASERVHKIRTRRLSSFLLAHAARLGTAWEADLLSFILFEGDFARQLIELGHRDALAKADEIRAFFGAPRSPADRTPP